MTDEEFTLLIEQLLQARHETPGVECKPPGPLSDSQLRHKVIRATLGMSNRRDGGVIVIGLGDDGNSLTPLGLCQSDLATWTYDHVSDHLQNYAEPSVLLELEIKHHQGKDYVVLTVQEFPEIPILCKKDFPPVGKAAGKAGHKLLLKKGACYVRSRRKPESAEIQTYEDMRALLELATVKALRQYLMISSKAGVISMGISPSVVLGPELGSQELFERQRGDLL